MTHNEWVDLLIGLGPSIAGWIGIMTLVITVLNRLMKRLHDTVALPLGQAVSTLLQLHVVLQDMSARLGRVENDLGHAVATMAIATAEQTRQLRAQDDLIRGVRDRQGLYEARLMALENVLGGRRLSDVPVTD